MKIIVACNIVLLLFSSGCVANFGGTGEFDTDGVIDMDKAVKRVENESVVRVASPSEVAGSVTPSAPTSFRGQYLDICIVNPLDREISLTSSIRLMDNVESAKDLLSNTTRRPSVNESSPFLLTRNLRPHESVHYIIPVPPFSNDTTSTPRIRINRILFGRSIRDSNSVRLGESHSTSSTVIVSIPRNCVEASRGLPRPMLQTVIPIAAGAERAAQQATSSCLIRLRIPDQNLSSEWIQMPRAALGEFGQEVILGLSTGNASSGLAREGEYDGVIDYVYD